jgi:hypothetical protein
MLLSEQSVTASGRRNNSNARSTVSVSNSERDSERMNPAIVSVAAVYTVMALVWLLAMLTN